MLINKEKLLEEIDKIKKDLLTDYKKKNYNDSFVSEANLLGRIENLLKNYVI